MDVSTVWLTRGPLTVSKPSSLRTGGHDGPDLHRSGRRPSGSNTRIVDEAAAPIIVRTMWFHSLRNNGCWEVLNIRGDILERSYEHHGGYIEDPYRALDKSSLLFTLFKNDWSMEINNIRWVCPQT